MYRHALRLLYYHEEVGRHEEPGMASYDYNVMAQVDAVANHLNMTMAQTRVIMILWYMQMGAARNEFGELSGIVIISGDVALGKSHTLKTFYQILPTSMKKKTKDESEKAWVLKRTEGVFCFQYNDEPSVGLDTSVKTGKNRDGKHIASGAQDGVNEYIQYCRAERDNVDYNKTLYNDARCLLAFATNEAMDVRLRDRAVQINAHDGTLDKSKDKRTPCEYASSQKNSPNLKAASEFLRYQACVSGDIWATYAAGATYTDVDTSLMEVFIAIYNKVMHNYGRSSAMIRPRAVERLRSIANGVQTDMIIKELYMNKKNRPIVDNKTRRTAFIMLRLGVISMRAFKQAWRISRPASASSSDTTKVLTCLKKLVLTHGINFELVKDGSGDYYIVDAKKDDVAKRIRATSKILNRIIDEASAIAACTELESTAINGEPVLKYNGEGRCMVLAEAVETSNVMTDAEYEAIEYLRLVSEHVDQYRKYSAAEDRVLFKRQVLLVGRERRRSR